MILIFLVIISIVHADVRPWQQRCAACSRPEAKCQMQKGTNRQIAEIHLSAVPEGNFWLQGCGDVDALHINYNMNNINPGLTLGRVEVDTLILSNVASIAPKSLSSISRQNANSIIFCNLHEFNGEIPNVGRLGFTGPLDESAWSLFPEGPVPREDSMSIVFTSSFSGLIVSAIQKLPDHVTSFLLEVTSADQFLLVTEDIVKSNHKPVVNVIVDTNNDEEDYLSTPEFVQRMAQLASAVEIRKAYEEQEFTQSTLPRHLLVNLIRSMFVTYKQIQQRSESSDLQIFFQADYDLKENIVKSRAVYCKPYRNGFRCKINIKQLFEHCESEYFNMTGKTFRILGDDESHYSTTTSSRRSGASVNPSRKAKVYNPNRVFNGPKPESINSPRAHVDSTNSQETTSNVATSQSKHSESLKCSQVQTTADVDALSIVLKERLTAKGDNGKIEINQISEPSESTASSPDHSCECSNENENDSIKSAVTDNECQSNSQSDPGNQRGQDRNGSANAHSVSARDTKDHASPDDEQTAVLLENELPQQETAAVTEDSKPSSENGGALDSPVVMISIVAGSVIVLTIALIAIFVASRRRRLKQSAKLQTPTISKNETDPETLWW